MSPRSFLSARSQEERGSHAVAQFALRLRCQNAEHALYGTGHRRQRDASGELEVAVAVVAFARPDPEDMDLLRSARVGGLECSHPRENFCWRLARVLRDFLVDAVLGDRRWPAELLDEVLGVVLVGFRRCRLVSCYHAASDQPWSWAAVFVAALAECEFVVVGTRALDFQGDRVVGGVRNRDEHCRLHEPHPLMEVELRFDEKCVVASSSS